jgi:D-aminoacyl-tRNA deacylase
MARPSARSSAGICLLVGLTHTDTDEQCVWMADKVVGLRLFGDAEGKMNLAPRRRGRCGARGQQFTLYGDAEKGRRPSFVDAARPEQAIPLYERFVAAPRTRTAPWRPVSSVR